LLFGLLLLGWVSGQASENQEFIFDTPKKKKKKRMKNVNKTELTIACLGDVNGDLVAINAVVERVMREHDLYVRVVF